VVQGGTDFDYTMDVANTGEVAAAGVHVADPLDDDLRVTGIEASGWRCAVTGADGDGYGGTLGCDLGAEPGILLGVGATAPRITAHVSVRPEIAQDDLDNTAAVTSTTRVVTGDDDTVSLPVKWLDATIAPQCVKDAPWLQYSVDAHHVDLSGKTMTVEWLDGTGAVVHTDTVPLGDDPGAGPIAGTLLWPGAAVDPATQQGILWPGWRAAGPGEVPQWENLVQDDTLPEYGLRAGGSVRISINPTTTLALTYPPATADCADAHGDPAASLWFTKDVSATNVPVGTTVDYVLRGGNSGLGAADDVQLIDPIPATLKVLSIEPATADPGGPSWQSCAVTGRTASGYGGTLVCDLDRPLGALQSAPAVTLTTLLSPHARFGPITNSAHLTGTQMSADLPTLADPEDSATIWTAGAALASTGIDPRALIAAAALLLLLGFGALIAMRRRRRTPREAGEDE
jgi:uncharacterized repeat protein (TIGR01451 family)